MTSFNILSSSSCSEEITIIAYLHKYISAISQTKLIKLGLILENSIIPILRFISRDCTLNTCSYHCLIKVLYQR